MELFLNSVWVLLGAASIGLWLRLEQRPRAERRMPLMALIMLIFLVFPVISVSDDLWAVQNPAETDTTLRRVHSALSPLTIVPVVGALPELASTEQSFSFRRLPEPVHGSAQATDDPALAGIESRPPPSA